MNDISGIDGLFRPFRGSLTLMALIPTAYAVGYILSPLRGKAPGTSV